MNEQAIRFRIGIFVLAALIALGVLIVLLNGLPYYFLPSTTYTIQFDDAQGVAAGTPVGRSGVKIGEVRRVTLDDLTGKVEVLIQVDNGYKLHKGEQPTLKRSVLGGDTMIAFQLPPGRKDVDPNLIEPGAVLEGVSPPGASDVIGPAEAALKEIKITLEKLTPAAEETLREIRIAIPKTSDTIQDTAKKLTPPVEKMIEKIDKMLPSIERAFDRIDKMAPGVEKAVEELRDVVKRLGPGAEKALERIDKLAPVVERAFDKVDKMAPGLEKTLEEFRRTADEIQVLTRTWNKFGERLDLFMRTNEDKLVKTIERVSEMFNDENQKNIQGTLKNVRVASDRFDAIAKNTDDLLKDSRSTLKTFNDSLVKVDKMVTDLQKATKPLGDRGESIMKNIDESTDKLNRTLSDVRELLQTVTRGEGTVQKLLTDPCLYNNLNEASLSLSRLMPRMEHILRDVEIFADKIARHPESLGIGGVVRPGSGVKESPTPYKVFPSYP
jgi:phospholipid/cholesterol/gamma-HCH transport system substrate-binding protein